MSDPANFPPTSLEVCKFISPSIQARTAGLKGKEYIDQVFSNMVEIFAVNLCRFLHAYHTFTWLDNDTLYLQVLEDSFENLRYTAKSIQDLKDRYFSCGDESKAKKLTQVFYKKMEEESKKLPLVGIKFAWGDYINSRMIEIGANFSSFSNWAVKTQYTSKWTDLTGMHRLDLLGGIAVS